VKKNLLNPDKPKKRKHTSYEPESQAALREAIKKAHSRIVGDRSLRP
jgi:hypothetical protein